MFSGGSRFTVSHNDSRLGVWIFQVERFTIYNIMVEVFEFSGDSMMM